LSTRLEFRVQLSRGAQQLDVAATCELHSLGLFGPSGAGKTSVLECLAGWRAPDAGFAHVGERLLFDCAAGVSLPKRARGIGYLPQDVLLFPHWSVLENVRAGMRAGAGPECERILERAVRVLDLEPLLVRRVQGLSGGERQRVGLARALVCAPRLLLLDEPLGALDLPLRRRILPYLVRTREEFDVPMILVAHDPTEVKALCDQVLVIEGGHVVEQGRPSAVLARPDRGVDPLAGVENVLGGRVLECAQSVARIALAGGVELRLPSTGLAAGERVLFGLRAKDVLISTELPHALSARNVLAASVIGLREHGDDVLLATALETGGEAVGEVLHVEVTQNAARELGLRQGARVYLVIKAHACTVLSTLGAS
jgi:molybdate transport system ATP-binding protein